MCYARCLFFVFICLFFKFQKMSSPPSLPSPTRTNHGQTHIIQLLRENQAAEGPKPGQTHYRNTFLYVCQPYFHTTNQYLGKFGIIESLETNFQCNHHIAVFILFKILVSMITVVFK